MTFLTVVANCESTNMSTTLKYINSNFETHCNLLKHAKILHKVVLPNAIIGIAADLLWDGVKGKSN
jgi:hypothetical protein